MNVILVKLLDLSHVSKLIINFSNHLILELSNLTGVAAILRFPLPDLDENDSDTDSETDEPDKNKKSSSDWSQEKNNEGK